MDDWPRQEPLHCAPTQPPSDYLRVEGDSCSTPPGGVARRLGRVALNLIQTGRSGVLSAVVGDAGRHVGLRRVHHRRHRARRRVRPSTRLVQTTEEFAS